MTEVTNARPDLDGNRKLGDRWMFQAMRRLVQRAFQEDKIQNLTKLLHPEEQCRLEIQAELADTQEQLARAVVTAARVTEELSALRQRLAQAVDLPLPVYLSSDFWPSAQPWCGPSPHPVVVCSIPKAGTYFVAGLLHQLGCEPTDLHLASEHLTDYRGLSREVARSTDYLNHIVALPLPKALALIRPGQFAVGHLECTEEIRRLLQPFKKIFVFRDLRDALVSYMRFLADTQRGGARTLELKDLPDGPSKMLRFLESSEHVFVDATRSILDWRHTAEVFPIRFETLYGDQGPAAQEQLVIELHQFLELQNEVGPPRQILDEVIGSPTMTWSGARSNRMLYWDDHVEERFRQFGGHEMNARLGYR